MRRSWKLGVLFIGIAVAAAGCRAEESGAKLEGTPPPVAVTTKVEPPRGAAAAAPRAAALSATIAAHRESTLSAPASGTVREVRVREGDAVKAGDLVVALDGRHARAAVHQAEAAIAAAQVQVDTARTEAERAAKLFETRAASERDRDLAAAQLRAAEAGLELARAAKEQADLGLADTQVRAPYDGVVSRRHVHEGDYVTSMPPSHLVSIQETGIVDLRISVPASRIGDVAVGTHLRVHVPALARRLDAKVARLVPALDAATRTVVAIAELEDAELRPGLFAEVEVTGAPAAVAGTEAEPGSP